MKDMSLKKIRELLSWHYNRGYIDDRKLLVSQGENGYGTPVYFFTLQGSPPKGYGIYATEWKILWLYDAWGKRFKIYYYIEIPELENMGEGGK